MPKPMRNLSPTGSTRNPLKPGNPPTAFPPFSVPKRADVLLSGDHAKVAAWRRAEAERITRERRPDLAPRKGQGSERE